MWEMWGRFKDKYRTFRERKKRDIRRPLGTLSGGKKSSHSLGHPEPGVNYTLRGGDEESKSSMVSVMRNLGRSLVLLEATGSQKGFRIRNLSKSVRVHIFLTPVLTRDS